MNKADIIKLARNPGFISGIYNYCDRWCERCAFTSRCLTYATAEEDPGNAAARDIHNRAFWDKLQEIFEQTLEMLRELAVEKGIDLNALKTDAAAVELSLRMDEARGHELSVASRNYAEMADNWLEAEHSLFAQKQDVLNMRLKLGIGGEGPYAEASEISDAVEVIRWYQHQIHAKFMRALTQDEITDIQDEVQNDSNGSALVALIAVDRSIGAWGKLQGYFPEKTDGILDILIQLDKLRRMAEIAFPGARDFKRPGFDDMN